MNRNQRLSLRLAFACMLAPDKDGTGSQSGKTIEEQLTDARSALSAAQSQVTALTTERDTARNELTTAQNEVTRLTNQFNSATNTATTAQADVTRLTGELSSMTTDRDAVKGKLTTAESNVTRLEKLCGLNGVDPTQAVPSESSENLVDKRAALVSQLTKETDIHKRAKIAAQLREYDAANKGK